MASLSGELRTRVLGSGDVYSPYGSDRTRSHLAHNLTRSMRLLPLQGLFSSPQRLTGCAPPLSLLRPLGDAPVPHPANGAGQPPRRCTTTLTQATSSHVHCPLRLLPHMVSGLRALVHRGPLLSLTRTSSRAVLSPARSPLINGGHARLQWRGCFVRGSLHLPRDLTSVASGKSSSQPLQKLLLLSDSAG